MTTWAKSNLCPYLVRVARAHGGSPSCMKRFRWIDYCSDGEPLELEANLGRVWCPIWRVGQYVLWGAVRHEIFRPSKAPEPIKR